MVCRLSQVLVLHEDERSALILLAGQELELVLRMVEGEKMMKFRVGNGLEGGVGGAQIHGY